MRSGRSLTLTRKDRCDQCTSAAAEVQILLTGTPDSEILFCGHHWERNRPALTERYPDIVIHDHRTGTP